jgi:hypothetical protein
MTGAPANQQEAENNHGSLGKEQIQESQSTLETEPSSTSNRTWLDSPLDPIEDDYSLSYCHSQMHQNIQSQVSRHGKLNRRVSYIVRPQLSTNTFPVYEKPHYLDEHSGGTKSTKKKKRHKKKSKRSAEAQKILERMNNRLQNIEDRMNHVHNNIHHHRDNLQRMKSHMGKVDNALSSDPKDKKNMYKSWRNLSVMRLSTVSDDDENHDTEDTLNTSPMPEDDYDGDRRAVMQKKSSTKKSWRSWRKKSNNSMKSRNSERSNEVINLDSGKRGILKRMSFKRKSKVNFETDDEVHEC